MKYKEKENEELMKALWEWSAIKHR